MSNEEKNRNRLSLAAGAVMMSLTRRAIPQSEILTATRAELAFIVHGVEATFDSELQDALDELQGAGLIEVTEVSDIDDEMMVIKLNPPLDVAADDHSWRSASRVSEIVSGVEMLAHFSEGLGADATALGVCVLAEGAGKTIPVSMPARGSAGLAGLKRDRLMRAKTRLAEDTLAFELIPAHRPGGRPDAVAVKRRILDDILAEEMAFWGAE